VTAPLVQRLSLVVDAATGGTETRMDALATASREAGDAAQRSAGQVAAAADRVAAARLKQDDAADRVALAERRLQEVQERYAAGSSQVLAAEQRLESSRRQLHTATRQVEAATEAETRATRDSVEAHARASTESDRARAGAERMSGQLDNLKGAAAGLVGFQVGDWLRDQATGYLNGARGAATLAASMNATVAQGGALSQLFSTLGLDSADLLEIQAEFATKIGENGRNLQDFGASLQTNANGTVNWAGTLTDALSQLQKIPDATERNRLGFQLFGEEGYKQLSRLLTSGMSVEDAMAAIGTPFTEEDVALAQEFDRDMLRLSLTSSELGRTIARQVVPGLADLAGGAGAVLGVVTQIPAPIAAATAAAIVMGRTGFDPLARGADALRSGMDRVRTAVSNAADGVEAGTGRMARGAGLARGAIGGLTGALGGPAGLAAIGIGLAWAAASHGAQQLQDSAREAALEVERFGGSAATQERNVERFARRLAEEAGAWEALAAGTRGAAAQRDELTGWRGALAETSAAFGFSSQGVTQLLSDESTVARGFQEAIEAAREELGEFGAQQELVNQTSQSLNNLIAEGTTSGAAFSAAVRDAVTAQQDQTRTSDTAAAAIAAYRAQTDQAVEAVRGLMDAQLAQADAGFGFLAAMDAANAATDDAATSVDEVAQAHVQLQEAALRAADAAADAAVAQARAAGELVTPLEEAKIRADSLITDLQGRLNTPGLSAAAQADLQGLIDQLTTARDKGDVRALVTLTGVDEATGQLEEATGDREARVNVESRGGPAVDAYLDRLSEDRLALIRTESRGGPAVVAYLAAVSDDRLSLIRVESRNGPAVNAYLNGLAEERLTIIRVETRGGPAVDQYLDDLAARRTAVIDVQRRGTTSGAGGGSGAGLTGAGRYGDAGVHVDQLHVHLQADAGGRVSQQSLAEAGRQAVTAIAAYERRNGPGWRGGRQ
jgi:hypothetical protein